ncbi:MAG TPA: DUF5693 family protein [Methylomusa anaerophila]|uniref:Uncharacterized protein n=1 Tax=Methylomusa anaerophila TaxID=1930071 RepID=A0A348AKY2_9FIRM|nr:DUF5693 family protein [Methylomusa anaerophila]BBB91730.1 hypothetical protein MAMMFC1_02414 [Methylomusa anaerophila]HML88533.1 DUF5693 family protein [Methylomusa anaerophila]
MTSLTYNRILIGIIIIGLLAALTINWQRHLVEEKNTTIEMVMDYEDLVELAQIEGIPPAKAFKDFKEAGVTSLAVYESTLEKLDKRGKAAVFSGANILDQSRTGGLTDPFWRDMVAAGRIAPEDVYITAQDKEVFAEVREDLNRRLGPGRVVILNEGERLILAAKANYEKVIKWNLGLPKSELREVVNQGYYLVPRPTNYTKVTPGDVNSVFERLQAVDSSKVSAVMFTGDEVLGYPDLLPLTVQNFKDRGLTLAMIEHPLQLRFVKQEGLLDLATAIHYKAARVYTIPKDEQLKMKISEAILRWETTTNLERNIRINLLHRFEKAEPGMSLYETNLAYISGVKKALAAQGFAFGRAGTFEPYFPQPWLLALVMLGATAAGVLLLSLIVPLPLRWQGLLLIGLAAVLIFPVLKGGGTLTRQMTALASALIFPVLGMTWQIDRWRKQEIAGELTGRKGIGSLITNGMGALIATTAISLAGGMYLAAVLSDIRFFLEMEIYRGVKLTFVMPLVLITVVYFSRYNLFDFDETAGIKGIWRQIVKILNHPIDVKTLLFIGAAVFAAWVYVGRSGHTAGVPVPAVEQKLRMFLEQMLYARPREKELIGHTAFLLAVMSIYQRWPRFTQYLLIVTATIAQGSLIETFAHLRTPVYMSFIRGLDGLVLGVLIGLMALVGLYAVFSLVRAWRRRPATHE